MAWEHCSSTHPLLLLLATFWLPARCMGYPSATPYPKNSQGPCLAGGQVGLGVAMEELLDALAAHASTVALFHMGQPPGPCWVKVNATQGWAVRGEGRVQLLAGGLGAGGDPRAAPRAPLTCAQPLGTSGSSAQGTA